MNLTDPDGMIVRYQLTGTDRVTEIAVWLTAVNPALAVSVTHVFPVGSNGRKTTVSSIVPAGRGTFDVHVSASDECGGFNQTGTRRTVTVQ